MSMIDGDGKDFVTDDNSGGYYVCECENCGHVFSSGKANGGGPIADSGDYNDIRCPKCDDIDPPQCENAERVWNIQQSKINHLLAALKSIRDYVVSEQQDKAAAYGDRLLHKQKAISDDLAMVDEAIEIAE